MDWPKLTFITIEIILRHSQGYFYFVLKLHVFDLNLQQKKAITLILCPSCSNIH